MHAEDKHAVYHLNKLHIFAKKSFIGYNGNLFLNALVQWWYSMCEFKKRDRIYVAVVGHCEIILECILYKPNILNAPSIMLVMLLPPRRQHHFWQDWQDSLRGIRSPTQENVRRFYYMVLKHVLSDHWTIVIDRLCMKLFKTKNMDTVRQFQQFLTGSKVPVI